MMIFSSPIKKPPRKSAAVFFGLAMVEAAKQAAPVGRLQPRTARPPRSGGRPQEKSLGYKDF